MSGGRIWRVYNRRKTIDNSDNNMSAGTELVFVSSFCSERSLTTGIKLSS